MVRLDAATHRTPAKWPPAKKQRVETAVVSVPRPIVNRMIDRRIRGQLETKNIDTFITNQALSTTSSSYLVCLNGLVPGTSPVQRVGREVRLEKLDIDMMLQLNNAAASGTDCIRVTCIKDMETKGALIAAADIWAGSSFGLNQVTSPLNPDNFPPMNKRRMRVLHDELIPLNANYSGNELSRAVKIRANLNNSLVQFFANGTSGTYTDIDSGAIWLAVAGIQATSAALLSFGARVTFTDA